MEECDVAACLSWIFTSGSRVEYRTRKGHLLRHAASSPHILKKNQQENITEFQYSETNVMHFYSVY
jgi:hypothetical protein